MTIASSTSQSVFSEPLGMTTSSLGPTMQEGALLNRIGSFGIGMPDLGGVVGVIEADGDEIADPADARAEARLAAHRRQRLRLDLGEARENARRQRFAVDVVDDLAEIAKLAGGVDQARPFLARLSITNQLHRRPPRRRLFARGAFRPRRAVQRPPRRCRARAIAQAAKVAQRSRRFGAARCADRRKLTRGVYSQRRQAAVRLGAFFRREVARRARSSIYGFVEFQILSNHEMIRAMSDQERIALFIDGANLYASAKSLGFDIDYKRLLKEFQAKGG